MAGHKAPGAVLIQTVKAGAEGQQLPGNGPGQCGPAHRGRPAGVQAPGSAGQLLRPVGSGGGKVQSDADHQPFQLSALEVGPRFGQDAADLSALIVQVVDPLDGKLQPAELFHGTADRHRGADGSGLGIGGGHFRAQQHRAVNALACRAFKSPAQPAASGALVGGEHQRAMGCTIQRQQLCRAVGALQRVI